MAGRKANFFFGKTLHFSILLVVFLAIHAYLFWHHGVRELYDSQSYIAVADHLLDTGKLPEVHQNFYLVHIGLIAGFRYIFPGEIVPYLIFQCVVSIFAVIALYRSAEKIYGNSVAGLATSLIYLLWIDNIHWNTVAMTESLMQSVICFLLYVLVNFKSSIRDFVLIILLSVLLVFIRPTGILIAVASCVFLTTRYYSLTNGKPMLRTCIIVAFAAVSYFGARHMFTHWDFMHQLKRGNIVTYADLVEGDPLYADGLRMDTAGLRFADERAHPMDKLVFFGFNNPAHFGKAALLKIFYLLGGVRPYYSVAHNLVTALWLLGVYILFFIGLRSGPDLPIRMFVLSVIVLNCALIGIATVDWDNRFYIPMAPGIVLLAGGGAMCLISCYIPKRNAG